MKEILHKFLKSNKDYPLVSGCICGIYAFLFYYSNNFSAIYSVAHFFYFLMVFVLLPMLVFGVLYYAFGRHHILKNYRRHLLLVLIITGIVILLSQAVFLSLKIKLILVAFIVSVLIAIKFFNHYKKILVMIMVVTLIPLGKCLIHVYEHLGALAWKTLPDDIESISLKHKPNIYIIQPDGYVSKPTLEHRPYNHQSDLYDWLSQNNFKVYDDFRSNYPASLASNASMFAMKQHYFGHMIGPTFELPKARSVISGNNPVLSILKRNEYHTSFIVQDEYFQQNRDDLVYDYYNISHTEIPFFSNDNNVKKVVFDDLKTAMSIQTEQPKFYFIEKLLPHHIHFKKTVEADRESYVKLIDSVNVWLKKTISYIEQKDESALIVVLADHGGWLGVSSYNDMFSTKDEEDMNSIYSTIAAIKWNGYLYNDVDAHLKSNVNLFRVLFSALSENKALLKHMEDDSSYNLSNASQFYNSVNQVYDTNGNLVFNKRE
ncbi:hypothetical protein [Formosa sp. Hel1_31_208]|uniref:hypothetical protein n=1 Tax=Formosa sp. Hel1_31_208 TaxID=1798225 RepID=UPI0012FDDC1B|nr:hypothetical protein [Formosa sp. Hel1_31_208]